ncbi:MAG TPA: hypothetical protein VI141_04375 [Acidimicrobiia bacterium]
MSTISTTRPDADSALTRRPASVITLAVLLLLLAVGSIQGGLAMVLDPTEPLGMTTAYLEDTPIDDYVLPGVFLLSLAAASLLTVVGLIVRWDWAWAHRVEKRIGYRWPWVGAIAIGALLLVFELIELFMVPFHPIMHPLLIAVSVAIIGLALSSSARAYLGSPPHAGA